MENWSLPTPNPISAEDVWAEVDVIRASDAMSRATRSQALLRYLVQARLDGTGAVKEYTAGVEVFDRGTDFDPKTDSIVRTEANRLRARLDKYYQTAEPAAFRIEMPKGEYSVRFVPVVLPAVPALPKDIGAPGGGEIPVAPPHRDYRLAALAGVLACAALGAWAVLRSPPAAPPSGPVPVRSQLVVPEGVEIDAAQGLALTGDGSTLAFVGVRDGKTGLWIRSMQSGESRLLAGTDGARDPFWSPDGRSIAYAAAGKLWRLDLDGGPAIALCAAITTTGGTWSRTGDLIFSVGRGGLRRVSARGGTAERFAEPDPSRGESSYRWPVMLPDGQVIFHVLGDRAVSGTYSARVSDPTRRVRILEEEGSAFFSSGHLLWLRGDTLVARAFDAEKGGLSGEARPVARTVATGPFGRALASAGGPVLLHAQAGGDILTWADRAGQHLRTAGTPGSYLTFRPSPRGDRIAVSRAGTREADLWIVDSQRNVSTRLSVLPFGVGFPIWSPGGDTVVFRGGEARNLYRARADGAAGEQRITQSENPQWPSDWSRNGVLLYTEQSPETGRDLWTVKVNSEGQPERGASASPWLRTRSHEFNGRFSPGVEPKWVAYQSDESGQDEIYVRGFPDAPGKLQISTAGGATPEWSADGKEIYYVSPKGILMAVDVRSAAGSVSFSVPRELFPLPVRAPVERYGVSPGGEFLVRAPAGGARPIEIVVNWLRLAD